MSDFNLAFPYRAVKGAMKKTLSYIERNGVLLSVFRSAEGIREYIEDRDYDRQISLHDVFDSLDEAPPMPDRPFKISVIVPAYNPEPDDFETLLERMTLQTYKNFELIVVDAGEGGAARHLIESYSKLPILYKKLDKNMGIALNTNAALDMASGDFVTFLDHDDFFEPDTLYNIVCALQSGSAAAYADEDKYDPTSDRYFRPNRKADFNLDLLLSNNYICHSFTVKTDIAKSVGGFREGFEGAQDYDFIIRCCSRLKEREIVHIPKVLYHWRVSDKSTADDPDSKPYAYESGKKVLREYLSDRGLAGKVTDTAHRGFYYIKYTQEVDKGEYVMLLDSRLEPMRGDFERVLSSYFARSEVGAVGARIIGRVGNIICNGYTRDSMGRRVSLYGGAHTHMSGYMHRASMVQDVEEVSLKACVIRRSLLQKFGHNKDELFENIRKSGYLVVIDPNVVFRYVRSDG